MAVQGACFRLCSRISSPGNINRRFASAFSNLVAEPTTDVDRRLLQIRKGLEEQQGRPISFYDPETWHIWNAVATDPRPWDEFIQWGQRFFERPKFDDNERNYKLSAARHLSDARTALESNDGEWLEKLREGFKHQNLVRWQAQDAFIAWAAGHEDEAKEALKLLWSQSASLIERLKAFADHLPQDLLSGSDLLRTMSFLAMAVDATKYPPITASVLKKACELTGFPPPSAASDEPRRYRHALIFFDRIFQEAAKRGLRLRDRLDAQGVLWAVVNYDPPTDWPDDDKVRFISWRDGSAVVPVVQPPVIPAPVVASPSAASAAPSRSLQQLADELFLPEDFLAEILTLLRERKQIILYGPPGTAKTYLAQALAEYLAPNDARREIVQFHPSYSYEDFVQGFRPKVSNGSMTYELSDGPLRRMAALAHRDSEDYVLLIDEINRGNLPRILGELLYALEYRERPVRLMYGAPDDKLTLPKNLLVIATMNTADRSIGLIDAALRRRFHFVPLFPGEGPLAELLAQWLDKYRPEMRDVASIVDRLNERLRQRAGRHLQVGHSYFMRADLSEEVLARIWENDVMPFLEDQFFGKEEDLNEFRLERLRQAGGAADEDHQADGARPADNLAPIES